MTDFNDLCMGCMFKKGTAPRCPNCGWVEGTMPESPQHLPPGTVLHGKYLVGRVLGQGGFGITYLGWDTQLDMKLAIKEYMPRDFATRTGQGQITFFTGNVKYLFDNGMHKFLEEAKILAKYNNHPGIVSVRDFFKENGTAYLVMYYLDGIDLKKYLDQFGGRLSYEQALGVMTPVMNALATVHRDGILHRDISPDNIYISTTGEVKLLDFGAARHAMNDSNKSLSVILKPGYAPEEQYRSKGRQGPWTDIYGAAATFYRLITGMVPPESLDRLEEDTLVPPSRMGVTIPARAEASLLKALSLKAQDRYQSMEEFYQGLTTESVPQPNSNYQQNTPTNLSSNQRNQPDSNDQHSQQQTQPVKKKKTGLIIGLVLGGGFLVFAFFIGIIIFFASLPDDPTPKPKPDPGPVVKKEQVQVPKLYNLTEDQAKAELEKAGLKVGKVIQQKNLIAKTGRVIQQSPDPDTKKEKDSTVDIYINSGVALPVSAEEIHQQGMPLVQQYWEKAASIYNQDQVEPGLDAYLQAREMARELYKFNGNIEARIADGRISDWIGLIKNRLNYPEYALEDAQESVDILSEVQSLNKLTNPEWLGYAYADLAWLQILNKKPQEALSSAKEGVKILPDNELVQINLAHAYLLNDYFRNAFKIYRTYKDVKFGDEAMVNILSEDFDKIEKAGYDHGDLAVIKENMLGIGVDTDEKQINRTIHFQSDALFAGDLTGYLSTYAFEPNTSQYNQLSGTYKSFFDNYTVSVSEVKNITIQEQTATQATVQATMNFEYVDKDKKEYEEEVTYKFILTKTNGPLPWQISNWEVLKNQ